MVKHLQTQSTLQVMGWRWMVRTPARWFALGLGSGLIKPGPGTWGTLMAWLLWWAIGSRLTDTAVAVALVVSFAYGCWICQRVGRELGRADHGSIVWDEIVAFWLVLWLIPDVLGLQALAFVLFRVFDIVKPMPIRYFDARFKNGFGVMWDDMLAAGYTLLCMAILIRLGFGG